MTLLNYMMSIKHLIGEFNIEEDHKIKVSVVRTRRALNDEQKEEVERLAPFPVKYIVGNI